MNKIPTAAEFIQANTHKSNEELLIEFAKLHVQKCKEEIADKAKIKYQQFGDGDVEGVDRHSILSAYPLTKIV